MFIRVEVDESVASDAAAAKQLAGICPVDIFADGTVAGATRDGETVAAETRLAIVDANLDECILCGLCLAVGAKGAVRVVKLYDDGALLGA
jgi:NAD-dependent dihydropyrimidine dehydrogenase PreA subunit